MQRRLLTALLLSLGLASACGSDVTVVGGATSSTSTTATSSSAVAASVSVSSSGGGGGTCVEVADDYGACKALLGWGLRDGMCEHIGGCDCEPDCDAFFPTLQACDEACVGACGSDKFVGAGLAPDGWGEGDYCDEVWACVEGSIDGIEQLFPDATCDAVVDSPQCARGRRCRLPGALVSAAEMDAYCQLLQRFDAEAVTCIVYGP